MGHEKYMVFLVDSFDWNDNFDQILNRTSNQDFLKNLSTYLLSTYIPIYLIIYLPNRRGHFFIVQKNWNQLYDFMHSF